MTSISFATANIAAEWLYSQGILNRNPGYLALSGKLFPYEVRFRHGQSELWLNSENAPIAIAALTEAQADDPYSPTIAEALMFHYLREHRSQEASVQFAKLVTLAPHSPITRDLLARRRDP